MNTTNSCSGVLITDLVSPHLFCYCNSMLLFTPVVLVFRRKQGQQNPQIGCYPSLTDLFLLTLFFVYESHHRKSITSALQVSILILVVQCTLCDIVRPLSQVHCSDSLSEKLQAYFQINRKQKVQAYFQIWISRQMTSTEVMQQRTRRYLDEMDPDFRQ